jgi:hypothetical protein
VGLIQNYSTGSIDVFVLAGMVRSTSPPAVVDESVWREFDYIGVLLLALVYVASAHMMRCY